MLAVETLHCHGFTIFDIKEDLNLNANLDYLRTLVKLAIRSNKKCIALKFTSDSYLSSLGLSSVIWCSETVGRIGGKFAFINPNPQILATLQIYSLNLTCDIVDDEEQLAGKALKAEHE